MGPYKHGTPHLVQEGLGFARLPQGRRPQAVRLRPGPTVSVVVAWRTGNSSPLVRSFGALARQCVAPPAIRKDVTVSDRWAQ
jgi:hypothetical protein